MKAIILAAGEGKRLKKYTQNLPKGMLLYRGKTLIEHQIDHFRKQGIKTIVIVRGYAQDRITYEGITYYDNKDWKKTNMVFSLMCARSEFDDDILVTYSDIFFTKDLLRNVIDSSANIAVAVDTDWQRYWQKRYGTINFDTESLQMDTHGNIVSLGRADAPLREIDGRYIGVIKFSREAIHAMTKLYDSALQTHQNQSWQPSGLPLPQAYMTDILQALIDHKHVVTSVAVQGGWLEFDTNEDYEKQRDWDIVHEPSKTASRC